VYDLKVDRHSRIAENKPVKSRCSNIAFNKYQPIILIGDSHGGVNSFKLSQTLCKIPCDTKDEKGKTIKFDYEEWYENEKKAMDECLLLGSMFDREEENT